MENIEIIKILFILLISIIGVGGPCLYAWGYSNGHRSAKKYFKNIK